MGGYVCMSHDDRTRAETKRSQWYPGTKTALRAIQDKALKISIVKPYYVNLLTTLFLNRKKSATSLNI